MRNGYIRYVKQLRNDPDARLANAILSAGIRIDLDSRAFAGVTVQSWMADELRKAEASLRRLRRQVEQRIEGVAPRKCPRYGGPVTGRAGRLYCSDSCRQSAHRIRHDARLTPEWFRP